MKNKYLKGYCPTLEKPILASDGLLLRFRPLMNLMDSEYLISLCDLVESYGSGIMEITNRGSIQIRGIKKQYHKNFLKKIFQTKIIKNDLNCNLNILINPFWVHQDKNYKIYNILNQYHVPNLPAKFGITVDLGEKACLKNVSADIRIENSENNKILVRSEGSETGKVVEINQVGIFVLKMIRWFLEKKDKNINKMSELLLKKKLPEDWCQVKPLKKNYKLFPSNTKLGQILGIKLGRFHAKDLKQLLIKCATPKVRFLPFKMILLEGVENIKNQNFISDKNDPFLNVSACSGKNYCVNSTIDTFRLAHEVKNYNSLKVHITGCEKNCGISKDTQILLTGNFEHIDVFDLRSRKKSLKRKKLNSFSKEFFKRME